MTPIKYMNKSGMEATYFVFKVDNITPASMLGVESGNSIFQGHIFDLTAVTPDVSDHIIPGRGNSIITLVTDVGQVQPSDVRHRRADRDRGGIETISDLIKMSDNSCCTSQKQIQDCKTVNSKPNNTS